MREQLILGSPLCKEFEWILKSLYLLSFGKFRLQNRAYFLGNSLVFVNLFI
jgi:hypothetical protein